MFQIGDKVKIVLDANLSARFMAFRYLKGLEKQIVDIAYSDEEKTKIHQIAVLYGRGNCWFFPSELQKI
jgi:hypothetical protein